MTHIINDTISGLRVKTEEKMIKDKILRRVRKLFNNPNHWVAGHPVDNTLGRNAPLSVLEVCQPEPSQIAVQTLPEFPSYVAIEVTNVCNLRCKHCNYRFGLEHYTRERGFINWVTLKKVLAEVLEYNIPVLMNYDGEPLIHRDFLHFLKYAQELGLNTYFNTNGTLFDATFADALVRFYRGSIFFSIDGDREWFQKIRVPASYDEVVRNLLYFIQVNEKSGWPITIGVSFCNLGQSSEERQRFLEEWINRVNYISMGEVNDKFGTVISDPMINFGIKKRPICVVPWQTCGICHNGDVIPCSIYVTRANTANAIMGNIHQESLKDIWQGERYQKFRQMVAQERYQESFCDRCQRWRSQFLFKKSRMGDIEIERNGLWTTFRNMKKGDLNFRSSI